MADVTIDICGENYSIIEIPQKTSSIVQKEREGLLEKVDLKAFVEDLGRVGGFVRVAYNGATAAGADFTNLQVKIQKIGFEVADLCDLSAITVAKFQDASGSILDDLQSTYEYLIEGEIEVAIDIFKGIVKVAEEMYKAAKRLQEQFDDEKKKVQDTAIETMEKKGATKKEAEEMRREREKQKKIEETKKQQLDKIQKEEEYSKNKYEQALQRQEKALDDMANVGFWGRFIGKDYDHMMKADAAKEARKEALKMLEEQRKERQKVLAEIGDAARKLIDCSEDKENIKEASVTALLQAEKGLKGLASVMRSAAQFWKNLEEHCKSLSDPRVAREFKMIEQKKTKQEQIKMFSMKPFKRGAIEFYAKWVSLNVVCKEYMGQIKLTQRKLYEYIRESPSYDQAKRDIGRLAKEFLEGVTTAQEELEQKCEEGQKEMKQLESSTPDQ